MNITIQSNSWSTIIVKVPGIKTKSWTGFKQLQRFYLRIHINGGIITSKPQTSSKYVMDTVSMFVVHYIIGVVKVVEIARIQR